MKAKLLQKMPPSTEEWWLNKELRTKKPRNTLDMKQLHKLYVCILKAKVCITECTSDENEKRKSN